jgi:predicted P-loop ATPase
MSKTNGQAPANNSGYDIRDHLSVLPQHLEEFQASAIESLSTLTPQFALTPVRGKIPYLTGWQSIDTSRDDIAKDIASGKADGYGIKLGIPSGGICAIDIDGTAARVKLLDVMGDEEMPLTVEFASGKPDRSQYLFTIPPELWDSLKSKSDKIPNGEEGEEVEEFGFFWNGRQSVLPPSAHPETNGYFWLHSPDDVLIAPIPTPLLEYWLNLITPPRRVASPKPQTLYSPKPTKNSTNIYSIPILRLLTKEHRSILSGISQGGRNNTGASLARDLIGVAAMGSIECDYRGKDYTLQIEGDAENLFYEYCNGCSPSLSTNEGDTIWKSAQHTADQEPCIRDEEILKNCARSYLKEILPKVGRPSKSQARRDDEKDYQAIGRKSGINLSDKGIDENGIPNSKLLKLKLDLFDLYGSSLEFNEMSREIELDRKPLDLNLAKDFVSTALEYDSSTENCIIALNAIATKFKYHPVREYLESLRGKTTDLDLIANFPKRYFGNSDPLQNRLFFRKLVASVARVMKPGTKDDSLLVLQGKQGAGKSTALKVLAGEDWFNDDLRSLDDKDEIAKLSRFWLLELAEVDYLFGKKEVELFKRFLSCTEDTFRPPYGRANILVKRSCGLFATTNKSEFLTDPTGDRRYWVVEVKKDIDIEGIRRDRDMIWATALAAYESGNIHYLDASEQTQHSTANTQWRDEDPWSETILPNLGSVLKKIGSIEYVNIQEIMDKVLSIPIDRQDKRQRNRIGATLQSVGFERITRTIDGKPKKVWGRDFSLANPSHLSQKDGLDAQTLTDKTSNSSNLSNLSLETIEKKENKKTPLETDPKKNEINLINFAPMTKDGLDTKDGLGTTPKPDSISSSVSNPSPNPSQKDGLANKDGLACGGTQEPKVGDRVYYAGDTKTLQKQYAGILEVYEIKGDRYTCKKPSGSLTSWIELADLQLVEVAA